jgi:hypothetical protein
LNPQVSAFTVTAGERRSGKALIVLLAGILGGLFACGSVLLREAMLSRNPLPEPITAVTPATE